MNGCARRSPLAAAGRWAGLLCAAVLGSALPACGVAELWTDIRDVPALRGVQPQSVRPGDRVVLEGDHLARALGVRVKGPRGDQLDFSSGAPGQIDVPPEFPSGWYELELRDDGWSKPTGAARLEVWRPDTEPPCKKRYALRVETERLIRRVGVDRILADGSVEHFSFFGGELVSLEREVTEVDGRCAALWLHVSDGRRILLADDPVESLEVQAEALAEALQIPLGRPEVLAAPLDGLGDPADAEAHEAWQREQAARQQLLEAQRQLYEANPQMEEVDRQLRALEEAVER